MSSLKISPKYQVVIPKTARQRFRIKPGDKVRIASADETKLVIVKEPRNIVDEMYGLGADMWESLGGADKYIEEERNSWDK